MAKMNKTVDLVLGITYEVYEQKYYLFIWSRNTNVMITIKKFTIDVL